MRYIYLFFLIGGLSSCLMFRSVPTVNQPSPTVTNNTTENAMPLQPIKQMEGEFKVLDNGGDSLRVMLALEIPRLAQELQPIQTIVQDFTMQYGILPTYNSPQYSETASIPLVAPAIRREGELYHTHFLVPKRTGMNAVMILEIIDKRSGEKVKLDFIIPYITLKIREKIGVFDKKGVIPYFTNYLPTRDTIQFRDVPATAQVLYVKYYKQSFEPATPPMILGERLPNKNLKADSSFTIRTNAPVQFPKAGLYFVQTDTTQYYGLGLYMTERKYPKLSYIKDVVEPLRYLTTDDEFFQLRNGADTKREMDKFWLKLMSNDTRIAQRTIKEFYNRVRLANRYFTTFKEGWKTDMGMIFIVYGRPSRIIRTNESEFWFYNPSINNPQEIRFTFSKKPNQFTDESYTLVRQSVYEMVWYPVIELWRSGKAF